MNEKKFAEDDDEGVIQPEEPQLPFAPFEPNGNGYHPPVSRRRKNSAVSPSFNLGKIPPQAVDLEELVLGALMLKKQAISEIVDFLKPDHFYKEAHQCIYTAILNLYQKNEPIDIATTTQQLKRDQNLELVGGPYFITQLTNRIGSSANIEFHARIILQKFISREMIRISSDTIRKSFEDTEDEILILDAHKTEIESLYSVFSGGTTSNASMIAEKSINVLNENFGKEIATGLPTGFPDLDEVIGGLRDTYLIVIAARPSTGKSSLSLQIADNVACAGFPVDYYILEMPGSDLVNRLLSMKTEIDGTKISRNKLSREELTLIENTKSKISANLNIIDDPHLTINQVKANCVKNKPRLIVVDYLQLMIPSSDSKKQRNREQDVSEMSRGLKVIAMTYKIPVIALSQLSRDIEKDTRKNKKPLLSDLRESGAIENDSDVVMFIYRPDMYKQDAPLEDQADIIVRKNRNGSLRHVPLRFIPHLTKFESTGEKEKEKIAAFNVADEDVF